MTKSTNKSNLYRLDVPDEVLFQVYERIHRSDPGVIDELNKAFAESVNSRPQQFERLTNRFQGENGLVDRRAPLNPFHAPLINKIRKIPPKKNPSKISDPALMHTPLRGRLVTTIMTSTAIVCTFFQTLVINKFKFGTFFKPNSLGPDESIFTEYGGVNTRFVRSGQLYRLFTAIWLHLDLKHLGLNLFSQIQFMYMIEPDWGFRRTMLLYFASGVTGFLTSCVLDPCKTAVGASGAMFGVMGALYPYCLEYWNSIPRPWVTLIYSLILAGFSITEGFRHKSDNWAHIGGFIGGFLYGFATIRRLPKFTEPKAAKSKVGSMIMSFHTNDPNKVIGPDGTIRKKTVKRSQLTRFIQRYVFFDCACGFWEVTFWILLILHLFINYQYLPIGSVSLKDIRKCCCCHTASEKILANWNCGYCDLHYSKKLTWKQICSSESIRNLSLDSIIDTSKQAIDRYI